VLFFVLNARGVASLKKWINEPRIPRVSSREAEFAMDFHGKSRLPQSKIKSLKKGRTLTINLKSYAAHLSQPTKGRER